MGELSTFQRQQLEFAVGSRSRAPDHSRWALRSVMTSNTPSGDAPECTDGRHEPEGPLRHLPNRSPHRVRDKQPCRGPRPIRLQLGSGSMQKLVLAFRVHHHEDTSPPPGLVSRRSSTKTLAPTSTRRATSSSWLSSPRLSAAGPGAHGSWSPSSRAR